MVSFILLHFNQGPHGQVTKWFQSKTMCTELLFGIVRAMVNNFQQPDVLKEYCDGTRFMEFKNLFQVISWLFFFNGQSY